MQVISLRRSFLAGVVVLGCLLGSQAALGVVAVSSAEYVLIGGDPLYGDGLPGFSQSAYGPNLGYFNRSLEDSAIKNGASSSASASQDFTLGVDAGTLNGRFAGSALGSVTASISGGADYAARSHMELVFLVPEGVDAIYRLNGAGLESEYSGTSDVQISAWDLASEQPGDRTFAHFRHSGAFDLGGALPPGAYVLIADVETHADASYSTGMQSGSAMLQFDFSVVPEPVTALLLLASVVGRSVVRSKR